MYCVEQCVDDDESRDAAGKANTATHHRAWRGGWKGAGGVCSSDLLEISRASSESALHMARDAIATAKHARSLEV